MSAGTRVKSRASRGDRLARSRGRYRRVRRPGASASSPGRRSWPRLERRAWSRSFGRAASSQTDHRRGLVMQAASRMPRVPSSHVGSLGTLGTVTPVATAALPEVQAARRPYGDSLRLPWHKAWESEVAQKRMRSPAMEDAKDAMRGSLAPLLPCAATPLAPTGEVRLHRDEKNLDDMGTG
jgi:hypothetical protein